MTSNIDPTVPVYGAPTTASVRDNFAIAKSEITALQNTASVPGPAGPAGPAGGPGAPGAAGPPGATGPAGTYQTGPGLHINSGTTPPTIDVATPYLALSTGGTLSGPLTLSGNATASLQPVSLQQLNSALSPYATTAAVAATYAPLANPVFTGAPQVPTASAGANSTQAASTQFVQTTVATGPSANNVGRNLLHNAMFNVAQRGAGPWTANGYMLDRWQVAINLDAVSFSPLALSDTARSQIGDEAAIWALQNVFTGNAGATAQSGFQQTIESVRRLSGKTVTVSFYAVAGVAGLKLGINGYQYFGAGGSPSASIGFSPTGNSVTLTATWARYSTTLVIPSTTGKTLGTNGTDCTVLQIYYSSGASTNANCGNIGVQSGTISIWGVQLEIGSVATPLEKVDPGEDLRRCQRFYQSGAAALYGYAPTGAGNFGYYVPFVTPMRAAPTVFITPTTGGNTTGIVALQLSSTGFVYSGTAGVAGAANMNSAYGVSADL